MRAPARRFEWGLARELRDAGLTYKEIGRLLDVSGAAVYRACHSASRARARERTRKWHEWNCAECGRRCFRRHRPDGSVGERCRDCAARAQAKVKDGKAYCPACKRWKPLAAFSRSSQRKARGVHKICRACDSARKRKRPCVLRAECDQDSRCRRCRVRRGGRHLVSCSLASGGG